MRHQCASAGGAFSSLTKLSGAQCPYQLARIEADRGRDVDKLQDVKSAVPTFVFCDE